jgi:hypothetical protein
MCKLLLENFITVSEGAKLWREDGGLRAGSYELFSLS